MKNERDLQPGDCLLVCGTDWIAHLIESIIGEHLSHTAIYLGPELGVVETTKTKVANHSLEYLLQGCDRLVIRRCPNLTTYQVDKIKAKALSLVGKQYDYREFVTLGIYLLFKKIGITWKWVKSGYKDLPLCNEAFVMCAEYAGVDFGESTREWTPVDLLKTQKMITIMDVKI